MSSWGRAGLSRTSRPVDDGEGVKFVSRMWRPSNSALTNSYLREGEGIGADCTRLAYDVEDASSD